MITVMISAELSVPSYFVARCGEVELALLQKSLFLSRELFHTSIAIHFIWMCQNWNMCWDIAISIQIMGMMASNGLVRFLSWLPCACNVSLFLNITCRWVVVVGHNLWLSPTWALPIEKHKLNDIMDPYVWRSQGIWGDRFYTYSLKSEGSKLCNGPECWSTKLPRQLAFKPFEFGFPLQFT